MQHVHRVKLVLMLLLRRGHRIPSTTTTFTYSWRSIYHRLRGRPRCLAKEQCKPFPTVPVSKPQQPQSMNPLLNPTCHGHILCKTHRDTFQTIMWDWPVGVHAYHTRVAVQLTHTRYQPSTICEGNAISLNTGNLKMRLGEHYHHHGAEYPKSMARQYGTSPPSGSFQLPRHGAAVEFIEETYVEPRTGPRRVCIISGTC